MEWKRSPQSANSKGLLRESTSDSEEWDTDLEDCCEKKRLNNALQLEQVYSRACVGLEIPPVSSFIKQMTSTKVDLRHYGVLDRGLLAICLALKHNITVITLNLHDNGITDIGARALADLFEDNCFITSLDISANKIGLEGCRAMERMLKNTSALRQLNFSDICSSGGNNFPLLEGVRESFYLKELNLSHNCLDDIGAGTLGSILSVTSSLESLNVSWNKISTRGAVDIMDGLRECYTLKELDFSWNCLSGPAAAQALRSALEVNESLLDLNVTNTSIGPFEAKIIAKGLKKNKTLQVLRIGKNPYLSPGVYAFLKAIRRNHESALRDLHLEGKALDRDCHEELKEVLQKRPDFNCTWQLSIQGGQAREIQAPEKPSPLDKFAVFSRSNGLRMVDLFKMLSGKYDTIKEEAFITGLKKLNIAMTKQDLKRLFAILDVNGDGKLQFHEFPNLVNLKLQEENALRGQCKTRKSKQ